MTAYVEAEVARREPDLAKMQPDDPAGFREAWDLLEKLWDGTVERARLLDPAPWHPLDLPWDEAPEGKGFPRDRAALPSLDEVLELRRTRRADVRRVVEGLTEETLAAATTPPDDTGWPPPRAFPVKECLSIVLNEEWWHRTYAERDLAILEQRPHQAGS